MKVFDYNDFKQNEAWLVFRLDTQVKDKPYDIYCLMDLPSGLLMGNLPTPGVLTEVQATELLKEGLKKSVTPKKILIPKDDPAIPAFLKSCQKLNIQLEPTPTSYLERIIGEVKESFGEHFFSPSSLGYGRATESLSTDDKESAKQLVPDSYDPCPCASGEKFKFCCKPGFQEIILSQISAEEGKRTRALEHINKAKKILGETAEVLCREAIIESFFDPKKAEDILKLALEKNPDHPRANYVQGLVLKLKSKFPEAVKFYRNAIAHYPKTDRYHLNETYNNLGSALFEMGDVAGAKEAWEQGLILLPSDRMVKRNLKEMIYENPEIPPELRKMGAFVKRFFTLRA